MYFIDMLSRMRERKWKFLKELASDEIAYRSLAWYWMVKFHSHLWAALQRIADLPVQLADYHDQSVQSRVAGPKQSDDRR